MLSKILNIFNKEKTMDDLKENQTTEAKVDAIVEEVKKETKKEVKNQGTSWFTNSDAK
jgi:hypothetical protein